MHNFSVSLVDDVDQIDLLEDMQSFNYTIDSQTISLLKKNFVLNESLYLLVKRENEFAAFCSLDRDWWEDGYFFLREIIVAPEFLQMGLGKALVKRCIDHARACKAIGIVTETDFENEPMKNLCESFGFIQWDNPQWNDGITYKLLF